MEIPDQILEDVLNSTALHIEIIQGEVLEDYFIDICNAYDKYDKLLVFTCHGIGKTHGMSCIATSEVTSHPGTKVIVTAPTFLQVRRALFGEINTRFGNLPPEWQVGTINQTEWNVDSETFIQGMAVQDRVSGERGQGTHSPMQGFHAKDKVVAIIDEGVGVRAGVWTMIDGITGTTGDKVVGIANPTSKNCAMYKKSKLQEYHVIFVTCFQTPNFIANGILELKDLIEVHNISNQFKGDDAAYTDYLNSFVVARRHLISVKWAIQKLDEWGVDHPLFQSKVIGVFPDEDNNVLIPENVVMKAIDREYEGQSDDVVYIGADIARFGEDSSVFTEIIGWKETRLDVMNKFDTSDVAEKLVNFVKDGRYYGKRKIRVAIDGGFGHGVIDIMFIATGQKKVSHETSIYKDFACILDDKVEILEINFGASDWVKWYYGWKDEKAIRDENLGEDRKVQEDRENYLNYKAKMFDLLARDMRNSIDLLDRDCYKQLLPTIIMQDSGQGGKFKIESKLDYKKRTGEGSPDEADSLALANVARYYSVKPFNVMDYYDNE
jgi:hypothetical protein